MKTSILTLTLLLSSCSDKIYDIETCNQLSMKKFKGIPQASKEFDENCQGMDVVYTQQRCQNAFNFLASTPDTDKAKAYFGNDILNCLTNDDLKRFFK